MKKLQYIFFAFFLAFAFASCGGDDGSDSSGGSDGGTTVDIGDEDSGGEVSGKPAGNSALSIWDGHSLKAEPEGKWLATINFGEEMTLLGETENGPKDKREYEKVRLLDGKEGWVRGDLISKSSKLAALKSDAQVYKRPSISNITDDMVDMGQLVVIKQEVDEFSEFIARNDVANKRKSGWLLGDKALTTNETDIAAAVMLGKAMAEKNPIKRKDKLKQIVDNEMFSGSIFLAKAQALLDQADAGANLAEDQLMITGDNVNVRSGPTIDQENKVFQVHSGDICRIVQRGDMDEIGGKLDYWYKISLNGQEGWVFGTFTSKAQ
jgi:uncharacterized protein YgiM (DUF1202 family)